MYDTIRDANQDETRFIIKRSGRQVPFEPEKIRKAIEGANNDERREDERLTPQQIQDIVDILSNDVYTMNRALSVEEIQDKVEREINKRSYPIFLHFHDYRRDHQNARKKSGLDAKIEGIIHVSVKSDGSVSGDNEEVKQENSNKNPTILSVQRDYIAGEWSRHYMNKYVLPKDIQEAHDQGIIHFHDEDYTSQAMSNCCLVNLEDMFQNGTKISGVNIETPKSFQTACTLLSQIAAMVAANQYGGQTMTLSHIAPFVDVSRQKLRKRFRKEMTEAGMNPTNEQINQLAEKELMKEIESGCQTIQYQLITLHSTNGQAPFITLFMYLDEVPEGQTRDDLATIIEVMLKQRIAGIPDGKGHTLTVAFPKLIYCLDEDNIHDDSKYFYLTRLAAQCSAKRLVPDYISAKKMRELKGDVYPCMGCVDGKEVIDYKINGTRHVEAFDRAWNRLRITFGAEPQPNGRDMIINPQDASIYDNEKGIYVPMKHMIRNVSKEWLELTFTNGRVLDCTPDHPFETNHGVKHACDLNTTDQILIDTKGPQSKGDAMLNPGMAWLLGLILCDGEYKDHASVTLGLDEIDVAQRFIKEADDNTDYRINQKVHRRGVKGNYLELSFAPTQTPVIELTNQLKALFGGTTKKSRHIPTIIFDASTDVRYAFLAGMIDADGYINDNMTLAKVQIGSTNKELALQQMLLAQSLGMPARIYRNHYRANTHDNVRYRVEFVPDTALIDSIASEKKKAHTACMTRKNASIADTDVCTLSGRIAIDKTAYSYDVTTESEHFTVSGLYSHNCRSFLTPDRFTDKGKWNIANAGNDSPHKHKYYGRFNQGVVTLNLVDIACSSDKDMDKFWKIFDERLDLCHRALRIRHETLLGTPSDVAPLIWQDGGLARLAHGETIDKLLFDGYSTISLGYAGLAECVRYMLGVSHISDENGKKFGLAVMQHLNDACTAWKEAENIDYSVYGSPIESTTYKFARCLQRRFGIIKNVTDHNYITNSYHTVVREEINAFDKLTNEAQFQQLSPGGAISYVEVPNMQDNIPAVLAVIKHIYNTIVYAELNTKNDTCMKCGYSGEIQIVKHGNKLVWKCPNCGNEDQDTMQVVRRTCGQETSALCE